MKHVTFIECDVMVHFNSNYRPIIVKNRSIFLNMLRKTKLSMQNRKQKFIFVTNDLLIYINFRIHFLVRTKYFNFLSKN